MQTFTCLQEEICFLNDQHNDSYKIISTKNVVSLMWFFNIDLFDDEIM